MSSSGRNLATDPSLTSAYVPVVGTPIVRNVTADGLKKFRQALAATLNSATNTKIALVGDSITYGYGATSKQLDSWAAVFQDIITARYNATRKGVEYATSKNVAGTDKRTFWTAGTGWTAAVGYGIFDGQTAPAGTTGLLSLGPVTCDSFVIYYMRRATTGTFDWNVDGGAATTIGGSGTDALMTATVSAGALGTHTLNIGNVLTGAAIIIGIEAVNSQNHITVSNAGVPSAVTAGFINTTNPWEPGNVIWDTPQPHLTVLGLGTNDYSGNVLPATFQTNLTTLVTKAQLYGSVLLWIEPKRTDVTGTYNYSQYVAATKAVAIAKACPYIDINEFWGGGTAVYDSGDHVHPKTEGHYQIARALAAALAGN